MDVNLKIRQLFPYPEKAATRPRERHLQIREASLIHRPGILHIVCVDRPLARSEEEILHKSAK